MKILLNAATSSIGGGVQVCTNLIVQSIRNDMGHEWRYVVSPAVAANLGSDICADAAVDIIGPSPAKIIAGSKSRKAIHAIEHEFQPDIVFTVFGPAYMKFNSTHLVGFADPWTVYPLKLVRKALPLDRLLITRLRVQYKILSLKKEKYVWVETESFRQGLAKTIGLSPDQIFVVPNSVSEVFSDFQPDRLTAAADNTVCVVFALAAPHVHKNLSIIPKVARRLSEIDGSRKYEFVVTLPENEASSVVSEFWSLVDEFDVRDSIANKGFLTIADCLEEYRIADIVFLPTLLEVFSATYLEGMATGVPIVTSDLEFARDVCRDAAVYFDPESADMAAERIVGLINNPTQYQSLVEKGNARIGEFPTAAQKYERHVRLLETLVEKEPADAT